MFLRLFKIRIQYLLTPPDIKSLYFYVFIIVTYVME